MGPGNGTPTNSPDSEGPLHGNETHPQEPSEQQIADTYHYENGSSKQVTYDSDKIEQYLLEYINEFRKQQNAKQAGVDSSLESSASAKSYHMVQNDYYAHESPGGLRPEDFVNEVGSCDGAVAENINGIGVGEPGPVGTLDSNKAVAYHIFKQWKNSEEGHREAMLMDGAEPSNAEIGVGVYITPHEGSDEIYTVYATYHVCA